ncbi:MAG: sirohydrochlorin chelatase [Cyanobacteriota bacterium]
MTFSPASLPVDGPSGRLGVLVCGHGSRNRLAVSEFAALAEQLREALAPVPVAHGYLEFARPILRDGLDALRGEGVEHVLAVPAMLFAAGHAKNDIPSVLKTYSAETGLRIDYGRELGVDRNMIGAAAARIREALAAAPEVPLHDTLLVVVGRGSSDPDANSNVAKVTRMLVEGFGFGWGETVYSGVTFPLVEPGLRHAVRLGFRRIVVAPYFLFSGVLVSRILAHTERVAEDHPDVEFLTTSYLGDHPLVLDTFRERVLDVLRGETDMNCSLCKYRAQVLGFEAEVGAPQHSHHHHVEGLTDGCTLCERECTGACQDVGSLPGALHPMAPGSGSSTDHDQSAGHPHQHVHSHGVGHDHGGDHGHGDAHDREAAARLQEAPDQPPVPDPDGSLHAASAGEVAGDDPELAGASETLTSPPSVVSEAHHHHHHPIYPHADHPLGPRTLRGL